MFQPTTTQVPDLPPLTPTLRALPAQVLEIMDELETEVEELRGLSTDAPIARHLMTHQELTAYLERKFTEEYPLAEIETDVRAMAAFDFVPRDLDLRRVLLDLYSSQILGLYDEEENLFYIISEGEFELADQITFVHEYVHALQDVYYQLETFVDDDRMNDDEVLARMALAEGDATAVMSEYLLAHLAEWTAQDLASLQSEDMEGDQEALEAAPPIIRETFEFPYVYGLQFVEYLQERGWRTVDPAFTRPPRSTEQILHPEKYLSEDEPQIIALPPLTDTLGAGWHLVEVETLGEFQTRLYLAQQVNRAMAEVKGITDTQISREEGSPEEVMRIDREKASLLGLSVSDIGEALQTAVGGTYASYFREGGKEYRILVRLSEEDRRDLADLLDLTVLNNRGEQVVLRNVVQVVPQEGPVRLERKDQERIITVSANFTGRPMGSVVADIRQALRSIPVPRDFSLQFGEEYEEQQKAFRELMVGLILALLLIYMVMAAQFESLKDPFVVLFSIPMALIGVTATMLLTGTTFSMQAFIGCIILAGIVVNNAIILVDYTNQLRRKHGLTLLEAIRLSGSRRLRPILMTTLTTVLGLLPLSLGLGEGGEAQAPLARVVIGGLLSSTLVTLVLVPVVYSMAEEKQALHKLLQAARRAASKARIGVNSMRLSR